jgi:hypothetical protein
MVLEWRLWRSEESIQHPALSIQHSAFNTQHSAFSENPNKLVIPNSRLRERGTLRCDASTSDVNKIAATANTSLAQARVRDDTLMGDLAEC